MKTEIWVEKVENNENEMEVRAQKGVRKKQRPNSTMPM
jgi:hypothetical protein